jgi:hypothetical protein
VSGGKSGSWSKCKEKKRKDWDPRRKRQRITFGVRSGMVGLRMAEGYPDFPG